MGLFDFASNLGKNIFEKDEDASGKIKETLEQDNPGIEDLGIDFKDGKVALSGKAKSAEAMEKAVLMAGNVKGVSDVDVSRLDAPEPEADVHYHVVESGDTLSGIAKRFLGDVTAYDKIFEANREVIKDPDLIYPGQKIRIPGADTANA